MTLPGRFTPLRRLGMSVRVCWTRTGEVIDRLPVGVDWDYSDGVTWSSLGSLTVTAPTTGPSTIGRRAAEQMRVIARAGPAMSLALVRDDDRRVMAAGYVTGASGTVEAKLTTASLGKLFDSRVLVADGYRGAPNDDRANLSFTLSPTDLPLELVRQGITGTRRDLPIDIPTPSGAVGATPTAYKAEDLVTVYEAVKKLTDRDDAPEVALSPYLLEDDTGVEWVRWRLDVGTPLLGSAALYQGAGELPPMPTWNWPHDVDLEPDVDYSEMVETAYVPGDSTGTGTSATDRKRVIGVSQVVRGGDMLPALERAERTNVSSADVTELKAQSASYAGTYSFPTCDWAISVPGDRWPLLGSTWGKGDLCRIRVGDGHWLIQPAGEYVRRIVAFKHSSKELLTLTTTDGSELGLPRWTP